MILVLEPSPWLFWDLSQANILFIIFANSNKCIWLRFQMALDPIQNVYRTWNDECHEGASRYFPTCGKLLVERSSWCLISILVTFGA